MEDRKQNNSAWIVDEFTEWIDRAIRDIHELRFSAPDYEAIRLQNKESTLKIVKTKFEQLKCD